MSFSFLGSDSFLQLKPYDFVRHLHEAMQTSKALDRQRRYPKPQQGLPNPRGQKSTVLWIPRLRAIRNEVAKWLLMLRHGRGHCGRLTAVQATSWGEAFQFVRAALKQTAVRGCWNARFNRLGTHTRAECLLMCTKPEEFSVSRRARPARREAPLGGMQWWTAASARSRRAGSGPAAAPLPSPPPAALAQPTTTPLLRSRS